MDTLTVEDVINKRNAGRDNPRVRRLRERVSAFSDRVILRVSSLAHRVVNALIRPKTEFVAVSQLGVGVGFMTMCLDHLVAVALGTVAFNPVAVFFFGFMMWNSFHAFSRLIDSVALA